MDFDSLEPAIWTRLNAIKASCSFSLERSGQPPQWKVMIRRGDEYILHQEIDLGDALTQAVEEAESLGWDRIL